MLTVSECDHDKHEHGFYVDDDVGVFYCTGCGLPTGHMPMLGEGEYDNA